MYPGSDRESSPRTFQEQALRSILQELKSGPPENQETEEEIMGRTYSGPQRLIRVPWGTNGSFGMMLVGDGAYEGPNKQGTSIKSVPYQGPKAASDWKPKPLEDEP